MEVEGGARETECTAAEVASCRKCGWWESGAVAEGGARPDRITLAMQDRIVSYLSPHKHNRNE